MTKYTPEQRTAKFWSRIDATGGLFACWEWTAYRNECGYGMSMWNGHVLLAHRIAWLLTQGEIPDDQCVCHRCDNPACCNPSHLFLGTVADNMIDRGRKGRTAHKLSRTLAAEIRQIYAQGNVTQAELCKRYGLSPASICRVVNSEMWT